MNLTPLQRTAITLFVVVACCLVFVSTARAQVQVQGEALCSSSYTNGIQLDQAGGLVCFRSNGFSCFPDQNCAGDTQFVVVRAGGVCPSSASRILRWVVFSSGIDYRIVCVDVAGVSTTGPGFLIREDNPKDVQRLFLTALYVVAVVASFGVGFWFSNRPKGGVLD